jgi:hypothetical protein
MKGYNEVKGRLIIAYNIYINIHYAMCHILQVVNSIHVIFLIIACDSAIRRTETIVT